MKTVRFINGEDVCALGQGTWNLGVNPLKRKQETEALLTGIDLGMTMIDTAEMYANEEFVGKAIHDIRQRVFLVTKVHPDNASFNGTVKACEQSLRRLNTDFIDLYLLHWRSSWPLEETVMALDLLRQSGKIRMWGVSNLDLPDLEKIMTMPEGNQCAANQVLYNLGERGIEYDLLTWSQQHNMPIIAYTPMGQRNMLKNSALMQEAERHNATPAQIALAWTIRKQGVMAIPKASTAGHVIENHKALEIHLTPEDEKILDNTFSPPTHRIPLAGW